MKLHPPLLRHLFGRRIRQVALLLVIGAWIHSAASLATMLPYYPSALNVFCLLCTAAGVLLGFFRRHDAVGSVWGMRAICLTGCITVIVGAFVATPTADDVSYGPLSHLTTIAVFLCGVAFSLEAAAFLLLVTLVAQVALRSGQVGLLQAVLEGLVILANWFVTVVVMRSIDSELRRAEAMEVSAQRDKVVAIVAQSRARQSERWDGLIHDKILAALTLAGRGDAGAAVVLAREALDDLADEAIESRGMKDGPRGSLKRHARTLGLDVQVAVASWPGGAAGAALETATCEALSNVARHAQSMTARVESSYREGLWRVVIEDDGVGFDPAALEEGNRIGLRLRIRGVMEAVGGKAEIRSNNGRKGSTIILTAPTNSEPSLPPVAAWAPGSLISLTSVGVLMVGGHIAIAVLYIDRFASLTIPLLAMVGISLLTVLATSLPVRSRAWWALPILGGGMWALLWGDLKDPTGTDWQTWFIGAGNALVGVMVLRQTVWHSLVMIGLGVMGAVVAWSQGSGHLVFLPVGGVFIQSLEWAFGAAALRLVAQSTTRNIAADVQAGAAAEAEIIAADERAREVERRQKALRTSVVPCLELLASATVLDARLRAHCRELEASTRDELVAATLLTPSLVTAIAGARRRGATVMIAGRADDDTHSVRRLRSLAQELMDEAGADCRVRVIWRPSGNRVALASLVGPLPAARTDHFSSLATDPSISVTCDDESVLFELSAPSQEHSLEVSRPCAADGSRRRTGSMPGSRGPQ